MDEGKKFIRTAIGYKSIESFKNSKSLTLPYEHINQNLCEFIIKHEKIKSIDDISLKNFSDLILNKHSSLLNLSLENEVNKCANELNFLRDYNCNLIVYTNELNIKTILN